MVSVVVAEAGNGHCAGDAMYRRDIINLCTSARLANGVKERKMLRNTNNIDRRNESKNQALAVENRPVT